MFTNELGSFGWGATLVFVAACCLRLARFNAFQQSSVNPKDDDGQNLDACPNTKKPKTHFVGVPAPGGALLVLLPGLFWFFQREQHQCFTLSGGCMAVHYWDIDDFAPKDVFAKNNSHPQTIRNTVAIINRDVWGAFIQLHLANLYDHFNDLHLHADY
jgi:phosphatidylserine synthase